MEWHGFRDEYIVQKDNWKLTRTFWQQTCCSSGDQIPPFTKAYLLKREVHYSSGAIRNSKWLTESEYLFKKLRGEV